MEGERERCQESRVYRLYKCWNLELRKVFRARVEWALGFSVGRANGARLHSRRQWVEFNGQPASTCSEVGLRVHCQVWSGYYIVHHPVKKTGDSGAETKKKFCWARVEKMQN